jgi:hypothetical protein
MASPLPISFSDFLKDPFKATMFLIIISVGYLYVDNKLMYQKQIEKSDAKIEIMDYKIDQLSIALKRSDSALAVAVTKLDILTQMK